MVDVQAFGRREHVLIPKVIDALRPEEWLLVTAHAGGVANATTARLAFVAEQEEAADSMSASSQHAPLIPETSKWSAMLFETAR